jgi:hypothetical protein
VFIRFLQMLKPWSNVTLQKRCRVFVACRSLFKGVFVAGDHCGYQQGESFARIQSHLTTAFQGCAANGQWPSTVLYSS